MDWSRWLVHGVLSFDYLVILYFIALNGIYLILFLASLGHVIRSSVDVVIAEHGVDAERRLQPSEPTGAVLDVGRVEVEDVAGQDDHVRLEGVRVPHQVVEAFALEPVADVEVGQVDDLEAAMALVEARDRHHYPGAIEAPLSTGEGPDRA